MCVRMCVCMCVYVCVYVCVCVCDVRCMVFPLVLCVCVSVCLYILIPIIACHAFLLCTHTYTHTHIHNTPMTHTVHACSHFDNDINTIRIYHNIADSVLLGRDADEVSCARSKTWLFPQSIAYSIYCYRRNHIGQ